MFQSTWNRRVFAWLLLVTVLAVCISPYADLDDCALRFRRDASIFFWLMAAALCLLVVRMNCAVRSAPLRLAAVRRNTTWLPPDEDVLPALQTFRI